PGLGGPGQDPGQLRQCGVTQMSMATRASVSGIILALGFAWAQAQTPQPAQSAAAAPASTSTATATAGPGPSEVVQTAAQGMLKDLDKDRAGYKRDPAKVGQLVDKYLLPHFDTEYSARLVLGKYWRTATPEQRQRFINAFYHSLLSNYGTALADFTADRLKIYPSPADPEKPIATVRTEVKRDNGDRVSVNYYMHRTLQGWKAWDVV